MTATTARPTALLTPPELRARVARLPRIPFAALPTPLEEAPNLSAALGGPRILVKRDDLTGFAFGGNKVRGLEFTMADVRAKGCDAFLVTNIGQSNHARLYSAACTRLGIHMVIVKPSPPDEEVNGNLLLDRILGVEIVEAHGRETQVVLDETIARLKAEGRTPYVSTRDPDFGVCRTAAYLDASVELLDQLTAARVDPARAHLFLVHGNSAAGLALGGKLLGAGWRVHAVSVGGSAESIVRMHLDLGKRVAARLELPAVLEASDFDVHDQYVGDRYGHAAPWVLDSVKLLARTDAIFTDPVYTGKSLSGMIGQIRDGAVPRDATAVFVHTGGLPIIFAYHDKLKDL
ncbi:MAG TPA: pyridoxal-phosphate dependent enzyme [Chloroflexota bacterium]|nr:pyridoxal-phosphate dependent enzyme [Chloroflexota bacterium]